MGADASKALWEALDDERSGVKQNLAYPPKVKEKILKAIDACNPSFRFKGITLLQQCVYTESYSNAKMDDVLDFMERLLKRGADPNEAYMSGWDTKEVSESEGHLRASISYGPDRYRIRRTKLLLKHGAKVSFVAFVDAVASSKEMALLLVEHGADPNMKDKEGRGALQSLYQKRSVPWSKIRDHVALFAELGGNVDGLEEAIAECHEYERERRKAFERALQNKADDDEEDDVKEKLELNDRVDLAMDRKIKAEYAKVIADYKELKSVAERNAQKKGQ